MKITHDQPGRLLVLEDETLILPRLVIAAVVLIPGLVLAAIAGPPMLGRLRSLSETPPRSPVEIAAAAAPFLLFLAPILGIVVAVVRATGPLRLFKADRALGSVSILRQNSVTGRVRGETIPLTQITGLDVQSLQDSGRTSGSLLTPTAGTPNVRVTLRLAGPHGRERKLDLPIDGIDKPAEVADFAYRLGRLMALPFQHVVRSDPRQVEIEMGREGLPGFTRASFVGSPADYAHDQAAPAALAATAVEEIPPFEPTRFSGAHQVTEWSPGREVRFDKPIGATIGCLPIAAAGLLAGPIALVLPGAGPNPLLDKLFMCVFFFLLGVPIGLMAAVAARDGLPHRVAISWPSGTVSLGGWFRRQVLAFSDIVGLELRSVHTRHTGRHQPWDGYRCELYARRREGGSGTEEPTLLVQTKEFEGDADAPYRQALPLVTELANALGVPRHLVDHEDTPQTRRAAG